MRSDENVIKLTLVCCGSSSNQMCEFLQLCSASSRFEAYFVCHLALVRNVKQVWPQHGNSQNLAAKESCCFISKAVCYVSRFTILYTYRIV